jgi:uncharacterized membrane protein YbhN (UPF0104 family)
MRVVLIKIFRILVVIATALAFFWFTRSHPEIASNLKRTPISTIVVIVLMYTGSISCLAFVLHAMLQLYGESLSCSEYFLLTSYSSLINFFGVGQSGPGVRALYLKTKFDFPIRHFLFGTYIYFAWLILLSGVMLIAPSLPIWQTCVYIAITAAFYALLTLIVAGTKKMSFVPPHCKPRLFRMVLMTGIGTALQVGFVTSAYFVELCAVDSNVTIKQAISFTGAANFSLFVSITPGAIGIREAFLFFSQNIHGVSAEAIATACALDRAVYFLVLALLGLLVLSTHAGRRFRPPGKAKSQGNP